MASDNEQLVHVHRHHAHLVYQLHMHSSEVAPLSMVLAMLFPCIYKRDKQGESAPCLALNMH